LSYWCVVDDAIRFASNHKVKEEEESTARTIIEEEQPTTRNRVFKLFTFGALKTHCAL
jgi:hypothetical protein